MHFQLCVQAPTPGMCRVLSLVQRNSVFAAELLQAGTLFTMFYPFGYLVKTELTTYIKGTVQYWSQMLILHSHRIAANIIEAYS